MSKPAWSARCDCYYGHNSSSGRCNCRHSIPSGSTLGVSFGVEDPTRHEGEMAVCADCRKNCPAGAGDRKENDVAPIS